MASLNVVWLRELAAKGGKGGVPNVDARALGRIADQLEKLEKFHLDVVKILKEAT